MQEYVFVLMKLGIASGLCLLPGCSPVAGAQTVSRLTLRRCSCHPFLLSDTFVETVRLL